MTNPKSHTTTKGEEVPKDLFLAFKIHTLAQTIHGQIASSHPWLVGPTGSDLFSRADYWPPTAASCDPAGAWASWRT